MTMEYAIGWALCVRCNVHGVYSAGRPLHYNPLCDICGSPMRIDRRKSKSKSNTQEVKVE